MVLFIGSCFSSCSDSLDETLNQLQETEIEKYNTGGLPGGNDLDPDPEPDPEPDAELNYINFNF